MATLQEDIQDFICNRIEQAYQEIIAEPEFKTLRKNIIRLNDQVLDSLPPKAREVFEQYCELAGRRSFIIEAKVYRLGLIDGSKLVSYCK